MKHLVAQFGLTLTSTCLGLGLIYLVIIKWSRYTPSLLCSYYCYYPQLPQTAVAAMGCVSHL
jgi:hypothetical protein